MAKSSVVIFSLSPAISFTSSSTSVTFVYFISANRTNRE